MTSWAAPSSRRTGENPPIHRQHLFLVLLLLVSVSTTFARELVRTTCVDAGCDDMSLECRTGEDCVVACNGFKPCQRMTVRVARDASAHLVCSAAMSCVAIDYDCSLNGDCTANCSGFNSCHLFDVDCGAHDCSINCTGRFSCAVYKELCDHCVCSGLCVDDTSAVEGTDDALIGKTNFINEFSAAAFDVHNVLVQPKFIQFYFPHPEQRVDLQNNASVSAFITALARTTIAEPAAETELFWAHPDVLVMPMTEQFIEEVISYSFTKTLRERPALPFVFVAADYRINTFSLTFNVTDPAFTAEENWQNVFGPLFGEEIAKFFAVYFNVQPEVLDVSSVLVDPVATFQLELPDVQGCELPQPFYGVLCQQYREQYSWVSSSANEKLDFPDLFASTTPTVAIGSVSFEVPLTLDAGELEITDQLSVLNSSLSLDGAHLTSHSLRLDNSALSTRHSSIVITGDLFIGDTASVQFVDGESETITVGGCVEFQGTLHLQSSQVGETLRVFDYACHSGEFAEVVLDNASELGPCAYAKPLYRTQFAAFEIVNDCSHIHSAAALVAPWAVAWCACLMLLLLPLRTVASERL